MKIGKIGPIDNRGVTVLDSFDGLAAANIPWNFYTAFLISLWGGAAIALRQGGLNINFTLSILTRVWMVVLWTTPHTVIAWRLIVKPVL